MLASDVLLTVQVGKEKRMSDVTSFSGWEKIDTRDDVKNERFSFPKREPCKRMEGDKKMVNENKKNVLHLNKKKCTLYNYTFFRTQKYSTQGKRSMAKRPLNVMVVDDEEQITDLLETFIHCASTNVVVHKFNNSVKARNFIRDNAVDILITDYKMPEVDGLKLIENAPKGTKKILISGYVSEIAEEKLEKMNAVFFEKPVPIRALGKIISETELNLNNTSVATQ
jgi:CheY-like chemotaxis protein